MDEKELKPRIRFKGFTEAWEQRKLGSLGIFTSNGVDKLSRENEENGRDYYFIDNDTFEEILSRDLFAEYDEYSQNRLYGTLKSDYIDGENKVVVLTPNGLRQLKKNCHNEDIFTVLVEASLGTRIKRYIDRCNVNKFNFDDADEIFARINRDFGMFLGLEKEVDFVVHNDEGTNIKELVAEILKNA